MPKGFSSLKEVASNFDDDKPKGPSVLYLKLPDDGDTAEVRFLDSGDDIFFYWYHDFSELDGKNGWKNKLPCLDQESNGEPCPGCEEELPRKFEALANIIWRDAPVYERDENGVFVKNKNGKYKQKGTADQVAVWRIGIGLFKALGKKDVAYKGLSSRDLEITRDGAPRDPKTKYHIEPADIDAGVTPLSEEDEALAENKYDVEKLARFVDEDKFKEIMKALLKKYKKEADDDDDEDDDIDLSAFMKKNPYDD